MNTDNNEKLPRKWWWALLAITSAMLITGAIKSGQLGKSSGAGAQGPKPQEYYAQLTHDFTLDQPPDHPICEDADGHVPALDETIDIALLGTRRIATEMRPDCWTKRIAVPENWPEYHFRRSNPAFAIEVLYADGFRKEIAPGERLWRPNCRGIFRFRGTGQVTVSADPIRR